MKKRILSLLLCAVLLFGLGAALPASAAHTHQWTQTVTQAQIGKSGKRVQTCRQCGKQKKTTIPAVKKIALRQKSFVFDGKTKTPAVVVTDKAGNTLKKGTDYRVKYAAGRRAVGTYGVKVTLRGNYKGSRTLTFKIYPKAPTGLKAAAVTADSVSLQWKAVKGATGYVVYRYYPEKNAYGKLKTVKGTAYAVKNLAPQTAYSFAVRAYTKTAKGSILSAYGKVLTVQTAALPPAEPTRYLGVQKILQTGVYSVGLRFEEMPDASYRLQRRGEDYYIEMHMTDGGESYDADLYYDGTAQTVYTRMLGIWFELDDEEMKGMAKELDLLRLIDLRDPAGVEGGKATFGGKDCDTETVTAKDGSVTQLWFQNGRLVRLGLSAEGEETVWCGIDGFSGKVGTFEKPKHPIKLSA
ncbi:MAG: fibronectin type III domain-containing protein [Clostridia bacterium]|nr:fibronectin type III domain-containing protein [Clostridia bacterium]